jgi:hypothetical protein
MEWSKWITAGLLLMMVIYIFPRARHMLKASPKGSSHDWMGFVMIIVVIALFIVLLTTMV